MADKLFTRSEFIDRAIPYYVLVIIQAFKDREIGNIIGNEFYNGNIQNWGPGGVFEGEGRSFRYPLILRDKDGKGSKTWHVDAGLPADQVITGMYKFGANELSIMRALDRAISHLERNYGLALGKAKK
jgi:hypothetical protein